MMVDNELVVVVTDAAGNTKSFDSHAANPMDRLQGLTFGTQQGSGFYTQTFTLSCPLDYERDDIHLLDHVQTVGAGGDTRYEGFIAAMPRSMDGDGQASLTITCAGYMATANGQPFTGIFVDRDLSHWTGASRERIIDLLAADYTQPEPPSIAPDSTSGRASLILRTTDEWTMPIRPIAEAWYDTGTSGAGAIYYNLGNIGSASTADADWALLIRTAPTDQGSGATSSSGDLWATLDTSGTFTGDGSRYIFISFFYAVAGGGAGSVYSVHARDLAVYGNHGLPLVGDAPSGVAASDVIRYVTGRYCPLLNTGGVQDTSYPIHQLAFTDLTKPYDCFLKVNSYHLWQLAVWEGRTLHFHPVDMDDWDWQVAADEVGTTISLQGDEYTDLRNGIVVQYTNVATGRAETLLPDDHAELRDESLENPYNQHGWDWTGEVFQIPFPTTEGNALELGRLRLIEDNTPRAPGSITKAHWIRDRAGIPQPVSKVRSGDRVRVVSSVSLSDRPRLIGETSYGDDGKTITMSLDGTARVVEAYLDRTATALAAAGLG